MSVAGLIPARRGSKSVPQKNIRLFRGLPLYQHAEIVAAATCDEWYVSTDDPAIPFDERRIERPAELAQDDTPMIDVVKHFCTLVQCDLIVLLQPTQPLRTVRHVREALGLMKPGVDSVVSVVQIPPHMHPDWACLLGPEGELIGPTHAVPRRQQLRDAYYRDGTVYVLRPEVIAKGSLYGVNVVPLVIPQSESCSIDTEDDWHRAEQMAHA